MKALETSQFLDFSGAPDAWDERTVTVAGRTRRALVLMPAGVKSQTAVPLVRILHGCTQDAASFAAATLMNKAADRYGFVAVYPQQERADNQSACWNWFLPEHQARGAGEPASIAAIIREVIGTTSPLTINTRRVFVAGLSAGGAHGRDPGCHVPGPLCGGRGPLGTRVRLRHGHGRRLRRDGAWRRGPAAWRGQVNGGHAYTHSRCTDRRGALMHELLKVDGLGHAWPGGAPGGSYTDPRGPEATEVIWRFFTEASADDPAG